MWNENLFLNIKILYAYVSNVTCVLTINMA